MKPAQQPVQLMLVDDEALARERLQNLLSDLAVDFPHQLVAQAANAREALLLAGTTRPDVVLLDVQMPGTDGLKLAAQLRQLPTPPIIIFVTAHEDFAVQAFEVQATDYLLKPVRASRLLQALQRAAAKLAPSTAAPRQFSVSERGRVTLVPATQVLFLRAELKYISLHTAQGMFLIEDSLQSIEDSMPELFVRIHRNTLVAKDAISGVERRSGEEGEGWLLVLRGVDERLPVSRRHWPLVKALIRS
jgi:two-component system, LytTR family, response regulator AlgR